MMRKKITSTVVLALAVFLSLPQAAWGLSYSDIAALELKQRVDDNSDEDFIILDIRDEASYDEGHIPGAINVPLNELGYRLFSLDKTKDIIVYCDAGIRSKIACRILTTAGFKDVYDLTGGIQAWDYAIETSDGRVSI